MKVFTWIILVLSAAAVYGSWFGGNEVASKNEDGYSEEEEGGDIADIPPKLGKESAATEPDLDNISDPLPNPSVQTEPHREHARNKRSYEDEDEELLLEEEREASDAEQLVTPGGYKHSLNATEYLADDSAKTLLDVSRDLDQYFQTCDRCMDVHRCCIANDPTVSRTLRDIAVMIRDVYSVMQKSCSRCPRDGDWSEWGEWSTCSVSCGQGTRWRTRTCSNPKPEYGGQNCLGRAREESTCSNPPCCEPVNGGWSSWTYWSQCSVSCGDGYRNRSRTCSNPPPNYCGSQCQGSSLESDICRQSRCCVPRNGNWSPWTGWSSCSVTCGCGIKERSRLCNNPPNNECGNDCVGNSLDKDICTSRDCCEGWTRWSDWSQCTVSCGRGSKRRTRTPLRPEDVNCPGPSYEDAECNAGACCDWTPWTPWTDCRVTREQSERTRQRTCVSTSRDGRDSLCSNRCSGDSTEVERCAPRTPPVCWTEWSDWSQCPVSCGRGSSRRTRMLLLPGNANCQGPSSEVKECDAGVCCDWSPWTPWTDCSVTRGRSERTRQRTCVSTSRDGRDNLCTNRCFGISNEVEICDSDLPPLCWTEWSDWSQCPVSCGRGSSRRTRTLLFPGTENCPGPSSEVKECDAGVCCDWSPWTPWTDCSVTRGEITRQRTCVSTSRDGRDALCTYGCRGESTEVKRCEPPPPPLCWAEWTDWSQCPVSCGRGSRRRTRTLLLPGNANCQGPSSEVKECDAGVCCDWSPWTPWTDCSVTRGEITRQRTCVSTSRDGRDALCTYGCRGESTEVKRCEPPPPPLCWAEWTDWSQCPVSCGRGSRRRTRTLLLPGNANCQGPSSEVKECDAGVCCDWSPWTPWTDCSVTRGEITRQRTCVSTSRDGRDALCTYGCRGESTEVKRCEPPPPPLCWAEWTDWSQCPVSCGRGSRRRTRTLLLPGNAYCQGPSSEVKECDAGVCCDWSPWTPWTDCSVTRGEITRQRTCVSTSRDGRDALCTYGCRGESTEVKRCEPPPPPLCWAEWTDWSQCPVSCGRGSRRRTRTLLLPGNAYCQGPSSEVKECDAGVCCDWSPWTPWTDCSVTRGEITRQRTCVSTSRDGRDALCTYGCRGESTEVKRCEPPPPPVCWTEWTDWSQCSVSCGRGSRRRTRTLLLPGNAYCQGPSFEVTDCDAGACCDWSPWTPWTDCRVTRGQSERTRQRTCVSTSRDGRDSLCTNRCRGDSSEVERCEPPPYWGEWEEWCPCNCRKGVRSRVRACQRRSEDRGVTKVDINRCSGESREEIYCDVYLSSCPQCITSCDDNTDGTYQLCSSCREFVTCARGEVTKGTCRWPTEFDAFKRKCVTGESPSCALSECVQDCSEQEDGNYHSCDQCDAYVLCREGRMTKVLCDAGTEFDKHFGRCRNDNRPSPTCIRRSSIDNFNVKILYADDPDSAIEESDNSSGKGESEKFNLLPDNETTTVHSLASSSDISAERKSDIVHLTTNETATVKGDNSDNTEAKDHRKRHEHNKKMGMKKKVTEKRTNKSLLKVKCYSTCSGPGIFQSCRGCQYYVTCTKHGVAHVRKCPDAEDWDDVSKMCKLKSSTCNGRAQLIPVNGNSRNPFVNDMS